MGSERLERGRKARRQVLAISARGRFLRRLGRAEFGPEAAEPIAAIFARIDGHMPRPADWVTGPGSLRPNPRPWSEVRKDYAFVDELAALQPKISTPGYRERFDYWLNQLRCLRAIAKASCDWARFNDALARAKKEKNPQAQRQLAKQLALPARNDLVADFADLHLHLLSAVSNAGELGNVCNWQQQTLPVRADRARSGVGEAAGRSPARRRHAADEVFGPAAVVCARAPHRRRGR